MSHSLYHALNRQCASHNTVLPSILSKPFRPKIFQVSFSNMISTNPSAMPDVIALILSLNFLLSAVILVVSYAVFFLLYYTRRPRNFPPGPLGLPGLGNLLQINKSIPALTYSAWAHNYGQDRPLGVKWAPPTSWC